MNAPVLGVVLTSVEIGTRDIRHLVSVRPGSKGVEEPLEKVLEPVPHADVAFRGSETLEQAVAGNGNGNGNGTATADSGNGNLEQRRTATATATERWPPPTLSPRPSSP